MSETSTEHRSPRLGIALGSGSARGWAHIGVMRAVRESGLKPDVITGSSIGAMVGAAAAAESLDDLESWVTSLDWWDIIRYAVEPTTAGLADGERLMSVFSERVGEWRIEDLPVRFAAVATDLETGREVWLSEGGVREAIRASIALPGLFAPVQRDGCWLVDGGIVDPVPVSLCRALGAEIVVAVNLNSHIVGRHSRPRQQRGERPNDVVSRLGQQLHDKLGIAVPGLKARAGDASPDPPRFFEVLAGSMNIMQDRITRSRMAGDPPELLISPRLEHLALMDYDRATEAIEAGYQAATASLEGLLEQYPELARSRSGDSAQ